MNTTTDGYKPKQYRLREMPEDIYVIVKNAQMDQKLKCNCQFSVEQAIYKLIRKNVKQEQHEQS